MAKCDSYVGSMEVVSGLVPKNGKDFPILDAHYILVGDGDKRLDESLGDVSKARFSVEGRTLKILSGNEVETTPATPETP